MAQNAEEYLGQISHGMQTAHAANHSETPLLSLLKDTAPYKPAAMTDHANSQQKLFQNQNLLIQGDNPAKSQTMIKKKASEVSSSLPDGLPLTTNQRCVTANTLNNSKFSHLGLNIKNSVPSKQSSVPKGRTSSTKSRSFGMQQGANKTQSNI